MEKDEVIVIKKFNYNELTPDELLQLQKIFEDNKRNIDEVINITIIDDKTDHYIGILNNVIFIYCSIQEKHCLHDKKRKYASADVNINKLEKKLKKKDQRLDDYMTKIFDLILMKCLYNLMRNQDIMYKGYGIKFLNNLAKFINSEIFLSATEEKLFKYYLKNNYRETTIFDEDGTRILRRVLVYKAE